MEAKNQSATPLWVVGHSLGGVIAFDLFHKYPQLEVERFMTVGTQVGLFAEGDILWQRNQEAVQEDNRRRVPPNIQHWLNLYDESDMLSFKVAPIFDRVEEHAVKNGAPFPDSHSAYWDNEEVYESIFARK